MSSDAGMAPHPRGIMFARTVLKQDSLNNSGIPVASVTGMFAQQTSRPGAGVAFEKINSGKSVQTHALHCRSPNQTPLPARWVHATAWRARIGTRHPPRLP